MARLRSVNLALFTTIKEELKNPPTPPAAPSRSVSDGAGGRGGGAGAVAADDDGRAGSQEFGLKQVVIGLKQDVIGLATFATIIFSERCF